MLAQAAHLVDAVVPAVPLRHYVLSFPFELSQLAAEIPKVLRALARINYKVTARYFQPRAADSGAAGKTHTGALTFVHRFGSSLNPHLPLHVCVFDGVFVERVNEAPRFSPAQALSRDGLCELLERFALRVARWLRKHGFARDEQDLDSNETRVLTRYHGVIAPCARLRKAVMPQPARDPRPSCSAKRTNLAAGESKNHDARAVLSACARHEDVQLMIAPTNARSRGESPDKPCGGSQAMALGSSRREESTSCANGQALLQLDSSRSPHGCSQTPPTALRPIGACVIAELLSKSAQVMDAHNVLSVRHWDRIGRGLLYAATFEACGRNWCGGAGHRLGSRGPLGGRS